MTASQTRSKFNPKSVAVFFTVVSQLQQLRPMDESTLRALASHPNLSFGEAAEKFLASIKEGKGICEVSPGIWQLSDKARELVKTYPAAKEQNLLVATILLSSLSPA